MSHCPGCTKHYGPFPSCPGCGPEAELPIDPKRPTLRFPSTERVAALEAELARLTTFEQLIGYAPTMSCCQNALEHLGHLTARGERLTAAEAELATLRAALVVADEMAAQKHHGPRCYEHMSGVVIRCVCGADAIRARYHAAREKVGK